MKVRLSGQARAFLKHEASYLEELSHPAAQAFLSRLAEARRNLAAFPKLGFPAGLPIPGTRRLVMGDYVVDYELTDEAILITSIRHGRQADRPLPYDDDEDYES